MKKFTSIVAVSLLTVMLALTMTACGLSGTYENGGASYKFEGNKATYTWTIGPITYTSVSTYSMGKDEDGKETITFTKTSESKDGDTTRYDTALSFNKGKDNNGEYIEIGGTKYYKK